MTTTTIRYQAHCIWCGRDANEAARRSGHCARCGATLVLELDLDPRGMSNDLQQGGVAVRERRPRRRRLAEATPI